MTLRSGKIVEKSILKPCEKDDESNSKGKEEVEPILSEEKIESSHTLPFPHALNNLRKVNHNPEIFEIFEQ
ncbi:hypothetical protein PanWU01x14_305780, partial [Parasponia andersonii]